MPRTVECGYWGILIMNKENSVKPAVSFARRHVLGDLYSRCDPSLEQVPVYMEGEEREQLGFADESLGIYRDAFSFHLPDDVCKRLSAGHYLYQFEVEHSDPKATDSRSRVRLVSITLQTRKGYDKPVSRRKSSAAAATVETA